MRIQHNKQVVWENPFGARAQLNLLKCLKRKYYRQWMLFWNGGFIFAIIIKNIFETDLSTPIALLVVSFVTATTSKLAFLIARDSSFQERVLEESKRDIFDLETFSFVGFVCAVLAIATFIVLSGNLVF